MAIRSSKYPVQLVLMVSTDVGRLVEDVAEREELHKTEVLRSFLHAGIRKAGYGDVLTTDPVGVEKIDLGPKTGSE
jgi:hypothetical protein